jgi:hypothetical protein
MSPHRFLVACVTTGLFSFSIRGESNQIPNLFGYTFPMAAPLLPFDSSLIISESYRRSLTIAIASALSAGHALREHHDDL